MTPLRPRALGRRPRLSAVIACYLDAPAVEEMAARLAATFAKLDVDHEIIFVNDCSPDDARTVLARLAAADRRVIVVNHSRNFGSQAAFTSGMAVATGDAVALLDGDLQDPPELIADMYPRWLEGYDVVYGVRVQRVAPLSFRLAAKAFYRVFDALSYVRIPHDAGDFSLIDRRVVRELGRLPERDRFLRGLRAWVGFPQVGVPYVRPERKHGVTTNNLRRNIGWAKKGIFSFTYVPLEAISLLALAITVLAGLAIVFYLASYVITREAPRGHMTLLMLVLFLGGVQLLCLSIVGEYVGRIFEEVKQRPQFIVESIINDPREPPPPSAGPAA